MPIHHNPFVSVTQPTESAEEPASENSVVFGESEIPSIQNEKQGIQMQNQASSTFSPNTTKSTFAAPPTTSKFNPQTKPASNFSKTAETGQTPVSGTKYNIVDLAWIINMKVTANQRLDDGEAAILTLGFNADYNNLRLVFRSAEQNAFTPSSIQLPNTKIITTTNLFSETCAELLYKKGSGEQVQVLERMFRTDQTWSPNQSIVSWEPEIVNIYSKMSNGNVISFFLYQWQINLFESALTFMIEKAPILHMEASFRKN